MSQRDLAKLSGVAHDTIGQIERGERKARPSTIRSLAAALRVEPSELLAAEPLGLMVIKRDGRREPFDRVKLLTGISKACDNRKVPEERIEFIVDEIEAYVRERYGHQVRSVRLYDMVLARLRPLDVGSYLRFASVYPSYTDVEQPQLSQWTQEALADLRNLWRRLRSKDPKDEVGAHEVSRLDGRVKNLVRDLNERLTSDDNLSVNYKREVLEVVEELLEVHEVFFCKIVEDMSGIQLQSLQSTESGDLEVERRLADPRSGSGENSLSQER